MLTAMTAVGALTLSGVALADNVKDDVASSTGQGGQRTITGGGSTTVKYWIQENGAGGLKDCDAADGTPVTVGIGAPAGVTATPSSLSFSACGDVNLNAHAVTFTSSKPGTYKMTTTATDTTDSYNANGADWTLVVTNSAPSVAVQGVVNGAEYMVGSVPAATCRVTDVEDGSSSFPATLTSLPASGLGSQTASCAYTDRDGVTADTKSVTYTVTPPPNTKPSVAVTGVTNGAHYEIGTVPAAGCDVTDAEDGDSTNAADISGTLSHGLGDQTATCHYTDQGGLPADTKSVTYTIVDTGKPTITHTITPDGGPNGSNGWYKTNVTVRFDCADDGGSGIDTCTPEATLRDGAGETRSGTATDYAGNTATDTVSGINVDTQAPNAPTASVDENPNDKGWNNTPVTVTFKENGDNGPSGNVTCTPAQTVNTDTNSDGITVSGTCTDEAGNTSAATTVTIRLDTKNPTITHSLDSNANRTGWYNHDVRVAFDCADDGSDIDTCVGGTTLGEGADQSVTGTATDNAGNTATDTVTGINVDETNPTVGFNGGPAATYYYGNDPVAPICVGSDAVSGMDTCVIDSSNAGSSVGPHSYKATATDKAGNTATATLNYTVLPWTTKGYYAPVNMGDVWNTVKGGSTVPLKFELFAGSTELTSTSAIKSFTQKTVACPGANAATDEIELVTTGGTSLRYDATAGQYMQNWSTPKKPGTCYQAVMTAQDGSTISANFMLK